MSVNPGDLHHPDERLTAVESRAYAYPQRPRRLTECAFDRCPGRARLWLKNHLPSGTKIKLDYDREAQDGYGRDLAAIYKDGTLVNAEIARNGLGSAMSVGGQRRAPARGPRRPGRSRGQQGRALFPR
ncbi:thermonuclease family protein [Pseudoclavibacter sp. CFCC 11306]|uniref:thermonuclease family protein n=1 Tax=Pseudoclavibacter sp. CFCC 11306 TaxID=1564493 RepID=UPI0013017153|nr:thermonuclease family protein [Pseudoclavibacter sp. CFCC 11306]KAB1658875.1 thermonuclease family protein [Pseudoclavibacter sp. CFCC 11306]